MSGTDGQFTVATGYRVARHLPVFRYGDGQHPLWAAGCDGCGSNRGRDRCRCAHEFIMKMEDGYQTDVGENGVNLSVGRRQILSLLAPCWPIRVSSSWTKLPAVWTPPPRSRFSGRWIRPDGRADEFCHCSSAQYHHQCRQNRGAEHGRIAEMGTRQELLGQRGHYYHLYTMQWAQAQPALV